MDGVRPFPPHCSPPSQCPVLPMPQPRGWRRDTVRLGTVAGGGGRWALSPGRMFQLPVPVPSPPPCRGEGCRFPHGARALPHVSRRYSSPLIVSNNARVPGQRCLCQCLSRCRVLKYLDFNEIYIPEAVSHCALLWGPWGGWGWRVGDRVPWAQPFPPWMPSAGTEQPGWVLGNVPLPHLDLQNQPELRQRMGGRG